MKLLFAMAAFTALASALLFGPAAFRSEPQSAEAAFLSEVKKLLASDGEWADYFGWSVAISGDIAIVGARGEDSVAGSAGAAYVFQRNEGGADNWGEVKKLIALDAQTDDRFAYSVAVSGDTAFVGAVGGLLGGAGAVYVFQRDQGGVGNWGQVTKLTASDAQTADQFGWSVAISGDDLVVGAQTEDTAALNSGAAYVFKRDEGGADNWGEVKKLIASDGQADDRFGVRVAVSGDAALITALHQDAAGTDAGAAYVFQRNEGGPDNWGQVKKLTASNAGDGDYFGISVAVNGDTAIVGALREDAGAVVDAGAAYVFQRNEGGADNWGEVTKVIASDAAAGDELGRSVALSGDTAVVGGRLHYLEGADTGAAYVFQRNEGGAGNWGEVTKLTASDAELHDWFGISVAVSSDTVLVGAFGEDTGGSAAGAAYLYDLLQSKPTSTPCPPEGCPTPTAPPSGPVPEMALDVIAGGSCAGGVCQVATGSTFTLAVDVVSRPAAGYIAMQTYIDFGVYNPEASEDGAGPDSCSDSIDNGADGADRFDADCVTVELVYKPAAQASDEIVWPDLDPRSALRAQPGPGLLNLGGLTEVSSSPPPSTFEGNVTSVQMTCPSSPVQATINLLPYSDPIAQTLGSGFIEPGSVTVVPKVGSLTIDCVVLPTPTPIRTEMALDVIAGGACAGGVCQVGTNSTFTLTVDAVIAPPAGYIGLQTYIDFGAYDPAASEDGAGPDTCSDGIDNGADGADRFDADCVTVDLVYKAAAQASDEIIWPDIDPRIALWAKPGPGLLLHGGLTGIIPPYPISSFEGDVLSLQMTCPSSPMQATINLLPYGDPIAESNGSGFLQPEPGEVSVPDVGSLTIDCRLLPTPTPSPVDTDTDGDGCSDVRESGSDETLGGLRDPLNPWDFYDVAGPGGAPPDSEVDLFNDILGVVSDYSLDGSPPYDAQFDRGPTTGPNPWNMTAPDGAIDLFIDILGVIRQHGHDCR